MTEGCEICWKSTEFACQGPILLLKMGFVFLGPTYLSGGGHLFQCAGKEKEGEDLMRRVSNWSPK